MITASDEGVDARTANKTITVRVEDVNDNAPVFTIPTKDNSTLYATVRSEKPITHIRVSVLCVYHQPSLICIKIYST